MDVMLARNPDVVVFGEDVGYFGGVFRCTEGLQTKYGKSRVFDTPISEGGIVGSAVGMGAYGLRPVAEIQFADYFYPASDQLVSRRRGCATARPATSPPPSPCACPAAAASTAGDAQPEPGSVVHARLRREVGCLHGCNRERRLYRCVVGNLLRRGRFIIGIARKGYLQHVRSGS